MNTTDEHAPKAAAPSVDERVSIGERIAYGLGDFGSNMVWQMVTVFLLYFYTDVFGIGAAAVGTLLLVNRIWDGINDPLIGWLSDRTRSKFGNYRPFLLYGAVPFGVIFVLAFTTPDLGPVGKIIWVYATYFGLEAVYTLVNVPYIAMLPTITLNTIERDKLSSARFIGTNLAILVVSGAVPGLLAQFASEQRAFQILAIIFAVIGTASLWICFAFTKERHSIETQEKINLKGILKTLKVNGPLLWVLIALLFLFTGFTLRNSITLHYFKYNIGQEPLAGAAFAMMGVFGIIGAIVSPLIIKKIDKRSTALLGLGLFAGAALIWALVGDLLPLALVSYALGGFGMIMSAVPLITMTADTVEYGEWKAGFRAAGVIAALTIAVTKMGTAFGGALGGYILAAVNYVPNAAQAPAALVWIRNMVSLLPAIGAALSMAAIWFYKIDRKTYQKILSELSERDQLSD